MAKTYIDQAAAKRLIADVQLGEAPRDEPRTRYQSGVYEGLNMAYGAIDSMKPADVLDRKDVLQAITVGLIQAGVTIGGRVHQCIYDALPK